MCSTLVLHLSYTCSKCVPHLSYNCSTVVLQVSYTCSTCVLHLSYTCSTFVLHVLCNVLSLYTLDLHEVNTFLSKIVLYVLHRCFIYVLHVLHMLSIVVLHEYIFLTAALSILLMFFILVCVFEINETFDA